MLVFSLPHFISVFSLKVLFFDQKFDEGVLKCPIFTKWKTTVVKKIEGPNGISVIWMKFHDGKKSTACLCGKVNEKILPAA